MRADDPRDARLLDPGHPRRPGRRPRHRGDRRADLRHLDLHPGGPRRAQGLRVLAQRQPDAHGPGDLPGRAGRGRARPGLRLGPGGDHGRPRRLLAARRRGGRRRRPVRRHLPPAGAGLQALGPRRRATPTTRARRASRRSSRRRRSSSGSRRRPTRCCRSSTSPPSPSWPTRPGRCWRWTTRSPRPTSSSRSSSGPTSSSTARRSTSAATPTWSAGRWSAGASCSSRSQFYQNAAGGVPGPFDAYLTLRGHQDAGGAHGPALRQRRATLADWLAEQPQVERVYYPGLPTTPATTSPRRQMRDFGGMI